jgi:glutaredoxin 3
MAMPEVVIYTKSWCPYCRRAKALLEAKGASYEEHDVQFDTAREREMIERAGGRRTVPQIFIGERHVGGSDDLAALERQGRLEALLAAEGPVNEKPGNDYEEEC